MKPIALSLMFLSFTMAPIPEANAAACHAGAYRSGCVTRYGAVVRHHGYRPYANRCAWRAGRRVCW